MNPAQENHQRRIRTILAIRAVAIVCLAMTLPAIARGIAAVGANPGVRRTLGDGVYPYSARVLILLDSPSPSDVYNFGARYSADILLVALAAYLWFRSPHKLLRTPRREARP